MEHATRGCCSGQCSQGRTCPIKQACEVAEDESMRASLIDMLWAIGLAACMIVVTIALISLYR